MTAGRRAAGGLLAAAGLALVLALTLTPAAGLDEGRFRWCLLCGDLGLADFVANVLLLVPLAAGLALLGVAGRRIVAAAFLLATAVELAQLAVPGRESTLGDVAAATLGATLVVLARHRWPVRRSLPSSVLAAAAALAVMAGTGIALRPSLPPTAWFGQWTAKQAGMEWYRGTVLDASIAGLPLRDGPLEDSRAVRERLSAGEPLTVHARAGPRPPGLAPLFAIADADQRGILLVGIDGDDLVLRVRLRAADAGLGQPELRWRGVLASLRATDALAVTVRRTGGGSCLAVNGRERCGLGYPAGRGWALVHAVPGLPPAAVAALDGGFVALAALLVGLVVTRGAAGAATALVVLLGLAVLPPALGLLPTPALQLAASAAGLVAGGLAPDGDQLAHAPVDAGVG